MATMIEVRLDPEGKETIHVNADQVRYIRKHPHSSGTIIHFDQNHSISVATTLEDLSAKIANMR